MDPAISESLETLILELKKTGASINDPVSKLMVTALLHQAQKIKDEIANLPDRIVSRLCTCFVPRNKIKATPALCLVHADIRPRADIESHTIPDGTCFTYKIDNRTQLSYYPLFKNRLPAIAATHAVSDKFLDINGKRETLSLKTCGKLWLGLELTQELRTLENISFYIRSTSGCLPDKVSVANDMRPLRFVTASALSQVPMAAPFDCQQTTPDTLGILTEWQKILSRHDNGRLIYITDTLSDRDTFRRMDYPDCFRQFLESTDLDKFPGNTLWLEFDFGDDFDIPHDLEIIPNVIPVVNVNLHTVTLTQSSPIARLNKDGASMFLNIVETTIPERKEGFGTVSDDIVVRDFDADAYDKEILLRDVRNLYNRFIDDYHAFVDYHALKDGEMVRCLREMINKIGKSVLPPPGRENKHQFDSGTYVMRNIALAGNPVPVKVSYLTTAGRQGNTPRPGTVMENKKDAALAKELNVMAPATGGTDCATPDQQYELLRYYTLTSDRLFTKMDIDAFVRMQLVKEFGTEESQRITVRISIQGAPAGQSLMRGLYVDIIFKDDNNYRRATGLAFDRTMQQSITERSCLALPFTVTLSLMRQ